MAAFVDYMHLYDFAIEKNASCDLWWDVYTYH